MSRAFIVTAERTRTGWWVLECPEVGAVSQVKRLDQADGEMREAIAYLAHVPESDVSIDLRPMLPEDYRHHAEEAARESTLAAHARRRAAEESRAAARSLRERGLALRDVGHIMGISYQRAQQLVRS